MKATDLKPTAQATPTQGRVYEQGITYNQAGITYNEGGYAYGGVYGQQDTKPVFAGATPTPPTGGASQTGAVLAGQTTTYNEAGVSYNQAGYVYGGLAGQSDTKPITSGAVNRQPHNHIYLNTPKAWARTMQPSAKADNTGASVFNAGITYNEIGVSYNDSRYVYGGYYGDSDHRPLTSYVRAQYPVATASKTGAALNEQAITYNQAGITYNQAGYQYGGLYGQTDTKPLFSLAKAIYPSIVRVDFIGSGGTASIPPAPANSGMLIGILGLTY